ncbi:MAG: spermidine/putrescine ABC transporter substrate-binding protein [Desulfurococcales archaeon]|nr:spermidine/putrescine ABC transporter substrate-binding protein [Desulfurococcales archaeon]
MSKAAVAGILVVVIIILAGIGYLYYAKPEQRVLKVLNYSEYIDPTVLEDFEKEYGVKVVYDEYEAAEEAWAKLKAGGAGYDVIITAHSYVGLARQQGLLHPLDKSKLPNLVNLDPRIASHPADPEQKYAVPYMWGTTGIGYVKTCVKEPPRTWKQFYNASYLSQYPGKVSLLSEFSETVMTAMIALGYDPSVRENWNDQVMKQVENLLLSVKPYIVGLYGASQYMPELQNEHICLALAWSGDILVVQEENPNVEFVNPSDGALFWVDFMVIPRDAKHVNEALEFINFMMRPDIAARNVKAVWYASALKKSLILKIAEENNDEELLEILNNPLVYPPPDTKLIPSPVLDEEMSSYVETIRLHVMGG